MKKCIYSTKIILKDYLCSLNTVVIEIYTVHKMSRVVVDLEAECILI